MSTVEINEQVSTKLNDVRAALGRAILGHGDVCLTCSFQAECMVAPPCRVTPAIRDRGAGAEKNLNAASTHFQKRWRDKSDESRVLCGSKRQKPILRKDRQW